MTRCFPGITKFSCISASTSQCSVYRLDSSHYMEHFACVDFTEFLFLPHPFNRTGLGLIVFGLGLTRHVWSRSRSRSHSLWSRSQSRSHCVMVLLTSLFQIQKLCGRLYSIELDFLLTKRINSLFEPHFGGARGNVRNSYVDGRKTCGRLSYHHLFVHKP